VVADLQEDDDPEDRDQQERDGHSHVDPGPVRRSRFLPIANQCTPYAAM
jgi:hypothetical protein